MKPTRNVRSGLAVAAICAALATAGWLWFGDASFVPGLAKGARMTDAAIALHKPAPPSPAPSPRPGNVAAANVAALLGATAFAAPAPGAPAAAAASDAAKPATATGSDRHAAIAALDTRLVAQRARPVATTTNAFPAKSWFIAPPPPPPPPPPAPPPPPPPPQAPPLPFKYMGMLQESADRTVWYLVQGERLIVAATGDVIDATYRIDGSQAGQLQFTYLPLDQRQTLALGGPP